MPAEAKRVRHYRPRLPVSGPSCDQVELERGVQVICTDGGRDLPVPDAESNRDCLDRAGSCQCVAYNALDRGGGGPGAPKTLNIASASAASPGGVEVP